MPKIFISDKLSSSSVDFLEKQDGLEVTVDVGKTEDEIANLIGEYDAILVRSATKVTRKIIEAGKNLKLIGRAGAGVDNIDLTAASEKGILVINAPFGNLISVAELVFGHFFNLARRIAIAQAKLTQGEWAKKEIAKVGREIDGKTLGIVGLGKIGQLVAARAKGFNLKVLAFDPAITKEMAAEHSAELVSLEDLLRNSDLITIHVPLLPATKHMISTKQFEMMKKTAFIVSCARGGVVDEDALVKALEKEQIAGVGLDVFENEPLKGDNPLLKFQNVSLTPHIGGDTIEAQSKVGIELVDQIARALKGEMVEHIVNFPYKPKSPFPQQKGFIILAEKLGKFLAEYAADQFKEVIITTAGAIAKYDTRVLTVAVLKGLLESFAGAGEVNLLNAMKVAENKGIKIKEIKEEKISDYSSSLNVEIICKKQKIAARGAVINDVPQVVFLDNLKLNFSPEGYLLVSEHKDVPGVLAATTEVLSRYKINIAGMQLGREQIGGRAIMVLNIDSAVSTEALAELNKLENFNKVRSINV